MSPYKLLLPLLLLFVGSFCSESYAYGYREAIRTTVNPPVDKKKKARKKNRPSTKALPQHRNLTRRFWLAHHHRSPSAANDAGDELTGLYVAGVLLLLFVPTLFIIGVLVGGIGWFIAGSVAAGIWLFFGYLLSINAAGSGVISGAMFAMGIGILIALFLTFLGLFIWAFVAALPLLLTFSIILGSLALLGILLALVWAFAVPAAD